MKINILRCLYCFMIILFLPAELPAQVSQGFEGITTSLNCGNSSCYYVDPDSPIESHYLADHGNIAVSVAGDGNNLGFETEFYPTRSGSSGADGLSDGDAFGVAESSQLLSELDISAAEGSQAFLMQDTDGLVVMSFDYVDLGTGSVPKMSLQYFLAETTWEKSSGQNDRLYVRLEIDKCASSTTIELLDTDGGGPSGNSGGDLDDLEIEGSWNILETDLSPYIGCRVQLIIEFDSNATAESLGIDQVIFTEGKRQSLNPEIPLPEENILPEITQVVLVDTRSGLDIMSLSDGQKVDINEIRAFELSIRAETSETTESVNMQLSGIIKSQRIENVAPYTLFGNRGTEYYGKKLSPGLYTLRIIPYSEDNGQGDMGEIMEMEFEIIGSTEESIFILLDSADDSELIQLSDGSIINKNELGDRKFGIRFDPAQPAKGVRFRLSGPISHNRFEGSEPPYSLFGDIGTNILGRKLLPGQYRLIAKPVNAEDVSIDFSVVGSEPSISSFVLVDADTDTDIVTLIDGSVIDQLTLSTLNLNIRANATADVESVRLELNGTANSARTENVVPYALFGDFSGDYFAAALPVGNYTLTATPYSGNNLRGDVGRALTINFTVVDGDGGGGALKLYPNPAVTELQVQLVDSKKEAEVFTIQVHDLQGSLIRTYTSKDLSRHDQFNIPTYSMQSGVYYMTVIGSQGTVQKKTFVITK